MHIFRQLALFVSELDKDLTLSVNMSEFEAFKRSILAKRQALGKGPPIHIFNVMAIEYGTSYTMMPT